MQAGDERDARVLGDGVRARLNPDHLREHLVGVRQEVSDAVAAGGGAEGRRAVGRVEHAVVGHEPRARFAGGPLRPRLSRIALRSLRALLA